MPTVLAEPAAARARTREPAVRPVVLLILDGFGSREAAPDNAIAHAAMPHWTRLLATAPHTTIDASELSVGLPEGQMGNSEVGHLNIGAGRVVYQDFTRIDHAIATGEFAANPVLVAAVDAARGRGDHAARAGAPVAGRRAQPRAADRRDGRPRRRPRRAAGLRARLPRRPRHAAAQRRRVARVHGGRVRAPPGRADRVDRRPLLRDGPRPALGARRAGLRPAGRRRRAVHRGLRASGARRRLRARRERRVRAGDGDRRAGRPARDDRGRRRRRVHELPRRSCPADDARADRPGFAAFPRTRVPRLGAYAASLRTGRSSRRCRWRSRRRRSGTASASTWRDSG